MKKSVTLTNAEYERLINIAQLAAMAVDKYCFEENKKDVVHIMDSGDCDPTMKELYGLLLDAEDDLAIEIRDALGDTYFETPVGETSVLAPMNLW